MTGFRSGFPVRDDGEMSTQRATMKDVARASGVSPATVSFVLNETGNQTIQPATRERVRQAAAELGYKPHGLARALRSGSLRVVVLKVARLPHSGGSLASFIDGLDTELALHDHTLLVRYRDHSDDVEEIMSAISPRAVLDLDQLYFDSDPAGEDGGWTNGLAAHTAVQIRYLAGRGHSHLAIALGDDTSLDRLADLRVGYTAQIIAELGLASAPTLILGRSLDGASAALTQFRQDHPEVTAVAALNDAIALRLLAAARTLQIAVPGEIAVIGFDNTDVGELFSPSLTSVHIDAATFGRRMARSLLDLPTGSEVPEPATVIQRQSA